MATTTVTVAKRSLKMSSLSLNIHPSYFMSFDSSNAGEFQKLKSEGMYLGLKKGLGNPVVLC